MRMIYRKTTSEESHRAFNKEQSNTVLITYVIAK